MHAGGVASLVQVCARARYRYAQRELEQGQSTLLSWGKMDCKYCKLLRGIGTEREGGGKREKDVELPRHARQLTTSEYDVMLVCKEIYDSELVQSTCYAF